MVVIYNLQITRTSVVQVSSEIEETITVEPIDRPGIYSFRFKDDGVMNVQAPPGLNADGPVYPTSREFLDDLPANTTVYSIYRNIDDVARPDGIDGAGLRKIYFAPTGSGAVLAYIEDYPIDVGGFWGAYSVVGWAPESATVQWSNQGNIFALLLLLFCTGDGIAILVAWRLLNPKYRGPRLVTPLDPKR